MNKKTIIGRGITTVMITISSLLGGKIYAGSASRSVVYATPYDEISALHTERQLRMETAMQIQEITTANAIMRNLIARLKGLLHKRISK